MNRFGNTLKKRNTLAGILSLIVTILLILVCIYIAFYFLKKCNTKKGFFKYLMDFSFDPCLGDTSDKSSPYLLRKIEDDKEVYHISNQNYTYEQAKCKCEAYGGRLATKAEIINAYNNGADWCSYGWSEGQSAYYPTQKCSWDKLQGDKKHKNDCGMPGVNGGFFANDLLKFGVNCYGVKPKGLAAVEKDAVCPEQAFCERPSNKDASSKLGTDNIAPFSEGKWSQF